MRSTSRGPWKLDELAREAGVAPRTVRYYVQRGLLPPPVFRGPDTVYEERHLLRLLAIRRLQQAFLPLERIAVEIDGLDEADSLERPREALEALDEIAVVGAECAVLDEHRRCDPIVAQVLNQPLDRGGLLGDRH